MNLFIKRCIDIVLSIIAMLLTLPTFLIIVFWIKLDSPGPIIFKQIRVGLHGHLFVIYKFRTMIAKENPKDQLITVGEDPRITHSGHFLRKYKLDELPQLLNVLKGDMSFVGPRPEVPEYVDVTSNPSWRIVLSVLPGITCYASLVYYNESELLGAARDPEKTYREEIIPRKLAYSVRYVNEMSFWLDIKLIFFTILALFDHERVTRFIDKID